MRQPRITRPRFPSGYLTDPKGTLPWSYVDRKLTEAKNYWLCTVRPNGRPHTIPKWAVWVEDKLYFDGSPETRHARNIVENPYVSVHLESGDEVIVLDGTAREYPKPDPALAVKLAEAYRKKYADLGYSPEPSQWDNGGLFEVTPYSALAWTKFTDDPTKFTLEKA